MYSGSCEFFYYYLQNKEDCTFAMDNDSEEMFSSQERRGGGLTESVAVTVPDQPIFGENIICCNKVSI